MLSKNSFVSCSKACRRLSSKWNSSSGLGWNPPPPAQAPPPPPRPPAPHHALPLPLQHVRVVQPLRDGQVEQLVVGNAAPEEEREARGQLQVGYRVGRARRDRGRLVLEPEQEAWADQDAAHRQLDARLEAAARRAVAVQAEGDLQVGVAHRAPPGASRQRRDDGTGARRLLGGGGRDADEQLAAAGRLADGDGVGKRPRDRHAGDHRLAVRGPVRVAAQIRVEKVLDVGRGPGREVHLDEARAGGHRRVEPHALQDQPVALVPTHARRALHDAGPDPLAVDAHVQLVRLVGDPFEAARDAALLRPHLEAVLAGGREVVAERRAAARAERQRVVDPRALIAIGRDEEGLGGGRAPRAAERHLRDPRRGA